MQRRVLERRPIGWSAAGREFAWACAAADAPEKFAELMGTAFGGTYAAAAEWMKSQIVTTSAFVLIFSRGEGIETFLTALPEAVRATPMAGGAAAREAGSESGMTAPTGEDVAVFAITEGMWEAVSLRGHFAVGEGFRCCGIDPRRFAEVEIAGRVRGASGFLADQRKSYGLREEDWDRLAIIGDDGLVRHLHAQGGTIVCGANLPGSRTVRLALFDEDRAVGEIMSAVNGRSLVFGCAGLHGLFTKGRPWESRAATTYLYGEIATAEKQPYFTNLTFALLRRTL